MKRPISGLVFAGFLACFASLAATPARADICESEWQEFDQHRIGSWTTTLNEGVTRDSERRALRAEVFGNGWHADFYGPKPADPVAAFNQIADWSMQDSAKQKYVDAIAMQKMTACLARAMAGDLAAERRKFQPPPQESPRQRTAMNAPPSRKPPDTKPKIKEKAEIANHCVGLRTGETLFGGFTNSCGFPIAITWCAYHPVKDAWSASFDCDHADFGRGGLATVAANADEASHTHNAEKIFFFACRRPAYPRVTYTSGIGFYGNCQ